jgi:hypothetical protein
MLPEAPFSLGIIQEVITGRSRDTASGGREGLGSLISLFGKSFGMLQKCVLEGKKKSCKNTYIYIHLPRFLAK